TNPDYMRGPPWREVSGISYDHYIISQLKSTYSCLIIQVWARGIIKKKIHIPWTLTLPWVINKLTGQCVDYIV
ncbi:hypothetical protein DRO66_10705, partial [Candidatus Bathyarchaeota archaeon]